MAEIFVPESRPGAETARTILKTYDGLKVASTIFDGADEEGILLAGECIFNPGGTGECDGRQLGSLVCCTGGLADPSTENRELQISQYMEQNFASVDAAGLPMSYRWLESPCDTDFEFTKAKECRGSCTCSDKAKKAKCLAKQLKCKGKNIEGLKFPFMDDPFSVLGLMNGGDIEIIEFYPPPLTFAFAVEWGTVLFSPPIINLVVDFSVSVTVEYSIVLDSKGIREAVAEKIH